MLAPLFGAHHLVHKLHCEVLRAHIAVHALFGVARHVLLLAGGAAQKQVPALVFLHLVSELNVKGARANATGLGHRCHGVMGLTRRKHGPNKRRHKRTNKYDRVLPFGYAALVRAKLRHVTYSLEALLKRDRHAFEAFVRAHQRAVFSLLSRYLGRDRSHEVEDLAQETFVRAYNALPRFDAAGSAKISTWLLTIAARLAIDAKRKKQLPGSGPDALDGAPGSGGPERDAGRLELGRALEQAALELSEDQRMVFLLSDCHGLSHEEIACTMQCPENTVKTRLFRAREKMRAYITQWENES